MYLLKNMVHGVYLFIKSNLFYLMEFFMKMHTIRILIICSMLSHATLQTKMFDNDFDQEIQQMKAEHDAVIRDLKKQIHEIHENIRKENEQHQKRMNDVHQKMRSNQHQSNMDNDNYNITTTNSHGTYNYYSSNSVQQYTNGEKSIGIQTRTESGATTYVISITDLTAQSIKQNPDMIAALQELLSSSKKMFHSSSLEKSVNECIQALRSNNKNQTVKAEAKTEGNKATYTIKIQNSTSNDATIETSSKSKWFWQ